MNHQTRLSFAWVAVTSLAVWACSSDVPLGNNPGGNDAGANASADSGTMPSDSVSPSVCGNALREGSETCDDGNTLPADGCSASCGVEPLYVCNGAGPGSCTWGPSNWVQSSYLKAFAGKSRGVGFRTAISTDGSTLCLTGTNLAYVFVRNGSNWDLQGYLQPSNVAPDLPDYLWPAFGDADIAMSASGDRIAIAGPEESSVKRSSGAVYTYTRTAGVWSEEAILKAEVPEGEGRYGMSLAMSAAGDRLAIAAEETKLSATRFENTVTILRRETSGWVKEALLEDTVITSSLMPNNPAGDSFGSSLALSASGETLVVGSSGENSGAVGVNGVQANADAPGAGAVHIYRRSGTLWTEHAYLKASNTKAPAHADNDIFDGFGGTVALSANGTVLAVSADGESSSQLGINPPQDDVAAPNAGAVYVFRDVAGVWTQEAYVKATNTWPGMRFGGDLSLSSDGNALAISAPGEYSAAKGVNANASNRSSVNAGAVYFLRHDSAGWVHLDYLKPSNTTTEGFFGRSLALSADAKLLLVGGNDKSAATGFNGDPFNTSSALNSGVYFFTR